MSKLIVLNGPLGSGKSTLARAYAEKHPMTLALDIDEVWFMISDWRNNWEQSAPLAKEMGVSMARIHLSAGYDVVIPQVILDDELRSRFKTLANETNAQLFEILIDLSKEEALQRYRKRLQQKQYPQGYKPDLSDTPEGKEKLFLERYDKMVNAAREEPGILRFTPELNQIDTSVEVIEGLTG